MRYLVRLIVAARRERRMAKRRIRQARFPAVTSLDSLTSRPSHRSTRCWLELARWNTSASENTSPRQQRNRDPYGGLGLAFCQKGTVGFLTAAQGPRNTCSNTGYHICHRNSVRRADRCRQATRSVGDLQLPLMSLDGSEQPDACLWPVAVSGSVQARARGADAGHRWVHGCFAPRRYTKQRGSMATGTTPQHRVPPTSFAPPGWRLRVDNPRSRFHRIGSARGASSSSKTASIVDLMFSPRSRSSADHSRRHWPVAKARKSR